MKKLVVKQIKTLKPVTLSGADLLLESQAILNPVDKLNWKEYGYMPAVNFRIAHMEKEIWLKYYVRERYIRAAETRTNGEVYKDSCVEFFLSFDRENYYNFEFNCIGTIHLGWGPGRHNRQFIDPGLVGKISVKSSLGDQPFQERSGDFSWEMMIRIPLECLAFNSLHGLGGLRAWANFFKCGDETTQPHFVTWNPVKTPDPDYHRPEYFGEIFFE
jgi:hypothetical protein